MKNTIFLFALLLTATAAQAQTAIIPNPAGGWWQIDTITTSATGWTTTTTARADSTGFAAEANARLLETAGNIDRRITESLQRTRTNMDEFTAITRGGFLSLAAFNAAAAIRHDSIFLGNYTLQYRVGSAPLETLNVSGFYRAANTNTIRLTSTTTAIATVQPSWRSDRVRIAFTANAPAALVGLRIVVLRDAQGKWQAALDRGVFPDAVILRVNPIN